MLSLFERLLTCDLPTTPHHTSPRFVMPPRCWATRSSDLRPTRDSSASLTRWPRDPPPDHPPEADCPSAARPRGPVPCVRRRQCRDVGRQKRRARDKPGAWRTGVTPDSGVAQTTATGKPAPWCCVSGQSPTHEQVQEEYHRPRGRHDLALKSASPNKKTGPAKVLQVDPKNNVVVFRPGGRIPHRHQLDSLDRFTRRSPRWTSRRSTSMSPVRPSLRCPTTRPCRAHRRARAAPPPPANDTTAAPLASVSVADIANLEMRLHSQFATMMREQQGIPHCALG